MTTDRYGRYASNDHDSYKPLPCGRCFQPPVVDWVPFNTLSDHGDWDIPGCHYCATPGCVDENGSNEVPQMHEVERP